MAARRVFVGGMKEETDTFVPFLATLNDFRNGLYWAEADQLVARFEGSKLEIGGFIEAIRAGGGEIVPAVTGEAIMAGPVKHSAQTWFTRQWLDTLERSGPVDAVVLALHGGTTTDRSDDPTGDILAAIRRKVGRNVFIGATLDLHAKITRKMVQAADVLYGFHTYPHVDLYEVGLHVGKLAMAWINDGVRPAMATCRVPMLALPGQQSTLRGPLAELMQQVKELESRPGILGASLFCVQAWIDVAEMGSASVVIADGDANRAQQEADGLGRLLWARRHEFQVTYPSVQEAVHQAAQVEDGLVVLADLGDGPGGGAGGDSTALLCAFLAVPASVRGTAMLTLTDPPAVAAAVAAGTGKEITVEIGGKLVAGFFEPVKVTGVVEYVGNPTYAPYGMETPMGPAAVLAVDGVHILLTERRIYTYAPEPYEKVGLNPRAAKMVVVKSSAQFRAAFEPIARKIILVNTPGPTSADLISMPFKRLVHPFYPWEDWQWSPGGKG